MRTGLFLPYHLNNIVAAMRTVEAEWTILSPRARKDIITNQVFQELHALQVPPPMLTVSKSDDRGSFSFESWTLNINPNMCLEGPRDTQIRRRIADLGGLIAHESRHCEQLYRLGRLWRDRRRAHGLKVAARELHNHLDIPLRIAAHIMASPRLTNPIEVYEATEWYQSFLGSGRSFARAVFQAFEDVGKGGLWQTDTEIGRRYHDTAFMRYSRGIPDENNSHCLQYEIESAFLEYYGLHADPPPGHWPLRAGVSEY